MNNKVIVLFCGQKNGLILPGFRELWLFVVYGDSQKAVCVKAVVASVNWGA
ncbi:Uncharacterised protein [Edwardsiella tarda]|nr:Uncharacterised protein [Edwardsiella tarda]